MRVAFESPIIVIIHGNIIKEDSISARRHSMQSKLNSEKSFENFIEDSSNRSALAASINVLNDDDFKRPLLLFGGTGCGKTHLLKAIQNAVIEKYPNKKVCYVTVEELVSEFVQVLRKEWNYPISRRNRLGSKCLEYDYVLLDGLEDLTGKGAIQEEVFYFVQRLYESRKSTVLTSLVHPSQLPEFTKRFERYSWNVCEIGSASGELKRTYTRKYAADKDIELSEVAIECLIKRFSKVGSIGGALSKFKLLCSNGMLSIDGIRNMTDESSANGAD